MEKDWEIFKSSKNGLEANFEKSQQTENLEL